MNTTDRLETEIVAERRASLSRRRFLRGLGAAVALPAWESLAFKTAFSAPSATASAGLATTASGAPLRTAFLYFPNGAVQKYWWPTGEGKDFELGRTMKALEPLKHRIQVVSGLDHVNATPGPDGPGDHARANGTFLTGVRVRKTDGANIQAGVSIDQVAAARYGHLTRLPSLELACDAVRKSGACDSGYSCAYEYNMAWRSPSVPLSPESNPRLVFERLFGAGSPGERRANFKKRLEQQRSILDFVLEDAKDLGRELGGRDRDKLDEYLTSIREIERQIQRAENFGETPDPAVETPKGVPANFEEHARLMFELLVLAFQTDSTRIATLLLAHDGSNRSFPEIGIPEGHHYLSHHRGKEDMMDKVAQIDAWYMRQFAWFLDRLENTMDVDGNSILHNSMIVYGCGNADGNKHTHVNLPVVLAGSGGGSLQAGRYLKLTSVPMSNLFLGMLDRLGVSDVKRFGDSTDRLNSI